MLLRPSILGSGVERMLRELFECAVRTYIRQGLCEENKELRSMTGWVHALFVLSRARMNKKDTPRGTFASLLFVT